LAAVKNPEAPGNDLKKLDIANLYRDGDLAIETNDPTLTPRLTEVFDGNTVSLGRSAQINPLVLTFTFKTPLTLKAVRLFPSHASEGYELTVFENSESRGVELSHAPNLEWSRVDVNAKAASSEVQLEVKRLDSDDYVHVNEIEIYGDFQATEAK
jgi:hypothetical protein